ncbi:MAG TPA: MazG family protein [Kineosporiaceae bacterium]|nr:MazG family protein [Kineosporiaceae bacterium]
MADTGRIVLVVTSPRVAPGLLSWPAWELLRSADAVLAAEPDPDWVQALADAGIELADVCDLPVAHRAGRLVELAAPGRSVAWFGSPDGDPGLTDALAEHLGRQAIAGRPPEIELVTGSHDVPGARLVDLVAVMDTLRSPGGCPWDAEQTHTSLLQYLLEETHEVIEAVERDDRDHLVEELGDLLLQVVFHARIGEERPTAPFDIDAVAAGVVAKLVRRHPHVFADPDAEATADGVRVSWEELKAAEKQREGLFEGIPATLPALARGQKMLDRLGHAGRDLSAAATAAADGDALVTRLLDALLQARAAGVDAESALRAALARLPGN